MREFIEQKLTDFFIYEGVAAVSLFTVTLNDLNVYLETLLLIIGLTSGILALMVTLRKFKDKK